MSAEMPYGVHRLSPDQTKRMMIDSPKFLFLSLTRSESGIVSEIGNRLLIPDFEV